MAGVTFTVFWSKAAAQPLLVTATRPPMAAGFCVTRTVNDSSSLWPGASARLPSVTLSTASVGSLKGSLLARDSRSQLARPVKPPAALSTPLRAFGGAISSQAATRPSGLSMSKVQFRLSMSRRFGAAATPVLVTFRW